MDTTFLVDLLRKNEVALNWLAKSKEQALYTSEINVFELYTGLYRISKKSKRKLKKRTEELEQVLARIEVISFEREAAIHSAKILAELMNQGEPVGSRDVMIAGVALTKGVRKLLTRNIKHFERIEGLSIESY
ncbi:MAG: type II toxin-antitoxin system VapC family toxin [Candidatus Thorarchaeota archaeon SMTZ1-45]